MEEPGMEEQSRQHFFSEKTSIDVHQIRQSHDVPNTASVIGGCNIASMRWPVIAQLRIRGVTMPLRGATQRSKA